MFKEETSVLFKEPQSLGHDEASHLQAKFRQPKGDFFRARIAEVMSFCGGVGINAVRYTEVRNWFANVSKARTNGLLAEPDIETLRIAFGPAMGEGTMQGRSFLQKYGYAGDFEIIDEIYRNVVSDDPALKEWDKFYHAQGAPKAVRNRKAYFKQVVSETLRGNPLGIEVLDIASGPCRDIAEFFEANPTANVRFTCVDVDERAIAYAKTVCAPWLDRITFIRSNALRIRLDKTFDLVWSAGLFDYFDDRGFVALLSRLIGFAKPDAMRVVVGNFVDPNPSTAYQEFGDWFLKYRTREKLVDLALACGVDASSIRVESEEEGINLFLRVEAPYQSG